MNKPTGSADVIASIPDIVYCFTPEGICMWASPSVEKLLGFSPDQVINRSFAEFCHTEDWERLLKLLVAGEGRDIYRGKTSNGGYLPFEMSVNPMGPSDQLAVAAVAREISERTRKDRILEQAMEITSIGVWEWDLLENKVTLSESVGRMFGCGNKGFISSPEELVQGIHPGDREELGRAVRASFESGALNGIFRTAAADEHQFMHLRATVTRDDKGNPAVMNGTVQDVTERKKVEMELQETVERYTSLKKYNYDAVFSLTLEGRIINGNKVAESMTGYKASEMSGQPFVKYVGEEKLPPIFEGQMNENLIKQIIHRDGTITEVLSTFAPIIINGEQVGLYVIAKDISEQKKLLIAKEAAERTNKAKSQFLAMMSHEIRTPMNGVIGMTDLLIDSGGLNENQVEYVKIIRKSGELLLSIINDILDFSKLESGRTPLIASTFSLRECMQETVQLLSTQAADKHLSLTFEAEPGVPDLLSGDVGKLKQVLVNLIGNALKFTYDGSVKVYISQLKRDEQDTENGQLAGKSRVTLKFSVQDTGIGIPEQQTEHLFEPFYQLDYYSNRKAEGTGLGLSISKQLAELMGGELWLEDSAPMQGSTFSFTIQADVLPGQEKEFILPSGAAEDAEGRHSLSILVAEDNEINQKVITKMLEKQGHSVSVVDNGYAVLDAVQTQSFDLIFMDVLMPELDGLAASRQLNRDYPRDKRPVIVAVTANAMPDDREKCLAAGMDDYISKPLKSQTLASVIEKYFHL